VFEKDCLIYLGTCVAPAGEGKVGKPCFSYRLSGDVTQQGTLNVGEMRLIRLGEGQTATMDVTPEKGFDVGAGPGKPVQRSVRGGTVGLVLDARGRPIVVPEGETERRAAIARWARDLAVYEDGGK
jgi:hypothetical protein